jgi:oligopeptide/dipeptide ABC transporter ATP-binding protein
MRDLRGSRISMIFQEPHSSLNPVFTIGRQIAEVFRIHQGMDRRRAWEESVKLLQLVGIPNAEQRAHAYPHEISGGQAQRVMIAMALALDPELLIADEPTTALDVTIQAQILDLLRDLARDRNTAVLLITHDLGIVADLCERVAVMYAGEIVEEAAAETLFANPRHPYTQGLIASIPALGNMPERLATIPGTVPRLTERPPGCRFAPRCSARVQHNVERCTQADPQLHEIENGHSVRCWLYES